MPPPGPLKQHMRDSDQKKPMQKETPPEPEPQKYPAQHEVHRQIASGQNHCRCEMIKMVTPFPDGTDRICKKCFKTPRYEDMLLIWRDEGREPPNDLRPNTLDKEAKNG